MSNFIRAFYHTLTVPEEWHPGCICVLGVSLVWPLSVLSG